MTTSVDEKLWQQNKNAYRFAVYFLPMVLCIGFIGFIYFLKLYRFVQPALFTWAVIGTPFLALVFALHFKKHWICLPDGRFQNTKSILTPRFIVFHRLVQYQHEFFYSRVGSSYSMLLNGTLVGIGIFVLIVTQWNQVLGWALIGIGLYLLVDTIKDFADDVAQLRLSETGIWTHRLGFVAWEHIQLLEIDQLIINGKPSRVLKVYLDEVYSLVKQGADELLFLDVMEHPNQVVNVLQNATPTGLIRFQGAENSAFRSAASTISNTIEAANFAVR